MWTFNCIAKMNSLVNISTTWWCWINLWGNWKKLLVSLKRKIVTINWFQSQRHTYIRMYCLYRHKHPFRLQWSIQRMAYKWHVLIVTFETVWFKRIKTARMIIMRILNYTNKAGVVVVVARLRHIFCWWIALKTAAQQNEFGVSHANF